MEKIWLKNYPKKVSPTIDTETFPSVIEVLESAAENFAERPAFANFGHSLSFAEVDAASRDFAAFLQSLPNIRRGDRIAVQLPNLLQFPVVVFGALRAGLTVVNTNPLYTEREMEVQFVDAGVKAIVICANFAHQLQKVLDRTPIETVIVTEIPDLLPAPKRWVVNAVIRHVKKMVPPYRIPQAISLRAALAKGRQSQFQRVSVGSNEIAFLQYTGGTTGLSKGAMLTHKNIVANMEQVGAWMGLKLQEGQEICIAPLPMYHVFSLTVNCLAFFKYGALNVLITNPRDIPGLIKELKQWKFTLMTGVNTLFNALLNHPDFATIDFKGLKLVVGGAMAVQRNVADRWKAMTGTPLLEGYGLTEASPVVCCNPPDAESIGTVGLPLPSTEIMLRRDDGSVAELGESGEICVRGPQVMKGYWNRPEETAKVILSDGWLRTGDVGAFTEDGFLKIVDRQKDMITVSGFKVYPNEVEDVLASHPKVGEVGVIGLNDEHSGEVVAAFVVRKDASLTAEELIQYSRERLTAYKRPKKVIFLEALPKTNVGKVLRRELRNLVGEDGAPKDEEIPLKKVMH